MKTVVCVKYGSPDVLEFQERPKPVPKDDEILIRTRVTTVTSGDWRIRSMSMPPGLRLAGRLLFGVWKPRQPVLGSELAGDVEAIGRAVTQFQPGDRVVVFTGARLGCSSEFKTISQSDNVVKLPGNLKFQEAVALPFGGTTALDFFRKAEICTGQRVLINGASGGVGVMAVQLAKYFGAHVTGVSSTTNLDLVRSLGADEVFDYSQENVLESDQQFDAIMDTVGTLPYSKSKNILSERGRLLVVMGGLGGMLLSPWIAKLTSRHQVIAGAAAERLSDLQTLIQLAGNGDLRAVIDQSFRVQDIQSAHRVVDSGRKRGSVVVEWTS